MSHHTPIHSPDGASRRWTSAALKLAIAGGLFAWLLSTGRLDLSRLGIFSQAPALALLAAAYWLAGPVLLASLRWRLLLLPAGYRLTVGRSIRLQLIGFFFTTVMPGSLGGDFVKIFYLLRDNPHKGRAEALWAALLDRIIGMCGLFVVGAAFISMNLRALWDIPLLRPVIAMVYAYLLLFVVFVLALKLLDPAASAADTSAVRVQGLLGRIYAFLTACRIYRDRLGTIALSVLLSTVAHGLSFVLFAALAWAVWGHRGAAGELASVFPLGMLITTLPLAPGGLGVGHLAFDHLFSLVGLSEGANIYNAYFISQLLLNLTGVLAFLGRGASRPGAVLAPGARGT